MADSSGIQSNATVPLPTQPTTTTTAVSPATNVYTAARERVAENQNIWTMNYSQHTPKYYFGIGLGDRGNAGIGGLSPQGRVGVAGSNGWIRLPLPKGLEDTQQISYTEYDLGPFWGTAARNVASAPANQMGPPTASQSALQALQQAIQSGDPTAIASASAQAASAGFGNWNMLSAGLFNTAVNVAPGGAVGGAQAIGGFAINQFYTVLLRGPTYKEHQLTFYLAPRNAQESTMIRNIIVRLRRAAAPGISGNEFFWTFPEVAHCFFVPQNQSDPTTTYMYWFKPAVIQAVSAKYDPGDSVAFYRGQNGEGAGAPESITLTLAIKEIEYWTKQDYGG